MMASNDVGETCWIAAQPLQLLIFNDSDFTTLNQPPAVIGLASKKTFKNNIYMERILQDQHDFEIISSQIHTEFLTFFHQKKKVKRKENR